MALRIHLTDDDLTRITPAQAPDPMWETLQSMHMLQTRHAGAVFGHWRSRVRTRLTGQERQLLRLAPPVGYSPDFLTPAAGEGDLDRGIEALLSTPRARLRHDLLELSAAGRRLPSWCRSLAGGDLEVVRHLGDVLRAYFRSNLAPVWDRVRARFDAERAAHARTSASAGPGALLGSLHPQLRWQPPVLTLGGLGVDRDVRLRGRGLVVLPSYFCWRYPTTLKDPGLPPVVVYPMTHQKAVLGPAAAGDVTAPSRSLVALLGRTRAEILGQVVGDGRTTTELARGTGCSPATASYHAAVLRDAGLLST